MTSTQSMTHSRHDNNKNVGDHTIHQSIDTQSHHLSDTHLIPQLSVGSMGY